MTGSGLRKRDVLDMMKGHRAEAGVWLDEVVRTGQPARSLRRRTPVTVLRTCGHGSGHQWLATVTRVFAEGPVHHPTMARLQLRPGICEAERQHGVLDDRAGLIVGERIVVIVPPLEVRTERHPPADI